MMRIAYSAINPIAQKKPKKSAADLLHDEVIATVERDRATRRVDLRDFFAEEIEELEALKVQLNELKCQAKKNI